MKKILFVEDDQSYRESLSSILTAAGYQVVAKESPIDAIEVLLDDEFDLIISDLQMKEMTGLRFLSYVKKAVPGMRTIILTGAATGETEIESLSIEVDQYLDKDIRMDVLLKYVEIILNKRVNENKMQEIILTSEPEQIVVNVSKRTVKKNQEMLSLTAKEFKILQYMLENKGFALSREDFIENVWDVQVEDVDLRTVDTHVKSLRKKLQTVSIASIRGYGYKWSE